MPLLRTELAIDGDIASLKLIGSVDTESCHLMWHTDSSASLLRDLLEAEVSTLIVDLEETDRVDSQGLRMMLNARKEFFKTKVGIILRCPNTHLKRLFKIMQFDRVFEIVDCNDE